MQLPHERCNGIKKSSAFLICKKQIVNKMTHADVNRIVIYIGAAFTLQASIYLVAGAGGTTVPVISS